jgi:glucokinase
MATAYLPALQHAVARAVPFPPEVRAAHFVHDAPLIGAIALAVDAASGAGAVTTSGHA